MQSDGLEKGMMLAHRDGRRRRGQPRRKWMDEIHEVTGMKLEELRDVTTERKQRRRLVKTVASTRWQNCTLKLLSHKIDIFFTILYQLIAENCLLCSYILVGLLLSTSHQLYFSFSVIIYRVSINAQTNVFMSAKYVKNIQIYRCDCVMAVNNRYACKILGQEAYFLFLISNENADYTFIYLIIIAGKPQQGTEFSGVSLQFKL